MTPVVWTAAALHDLDGILTYVATQSAQGAATIATRVDSAVLDISTFPRAARFDRETRTYECVVRGLPLLIIYQLVPMPDAKVRAEIVAVFHTSRDPSTKLERRS